MPDHQQQLTIQAEKTLTTLKIANIAMLPLLIFKRPGFAAILALNGYMIFKLHEIGKSNRQIANFAYDIHSLFKSTPLGLENKIKNVLVGGERVHDEIKETLAQLSK